MSRSNVQYERLSSSPSSNDELPPYTNTTFDIAEEEESIGRSSNRAVFVHDPRFDMPTPPRWQRVALLLFIAFLFWLTYRLRGTYISEEGVAALVE